MNPRPWLAAFGAIAAGAVSTACAGSAPARPSRTAAARPGASLDTRVESRASPDAWTVRVLIRELEADQAVAHEHIDADCLNGVLTLRGSVSAPLAKERAVAIAAIVQGVRAIVDRISVADRPRTDSELEWRAASALAADAVTAGGPVGARAHVGVIRLTGVVDSSAAKRIAENDVLAVPGVVTIVDDLAVEPSKRTDAQVTREVQRTLQDDPWLDDSRLEARTSNGIVTLTGAVASAAESARAEDDARASSPEGVDVAALRIDPADDGTRRSQGAVTRSDVELAAALYDAYAMDPRVRPFVPGFEIRSGMALLTGSAPDPETARAAEEDARNVPGMAGAHDSLSVSTAAPETDALLLYEARGALDRDPKLSSRGLTVEVLHGWVALRGNVASEAERRDAISVATSVRGVRGVDDDLVVEPPRLLGRAP
jgi:osmotically-inducible protein OsmY